MDRNLGASAGLLALFAMMFHLAPVGSEQRGSNVEHTDTNAKTGRNASSGEDNQPSQTPPLEGPWLATRALFGEGGKPPAKPAMSRESVDSGKPIAEEIQKLFGINDTNDIDTVLATVPDPWHTRLALMTDGALDAIEASATTSGWVFAGQWLPWLDPIDPELKGPAKRRRQRREAREQENEPGVLVFRHRFESRKLLVFIVGETPTGGMDRAQFCNARTYMKSLSEPTNPVAILGPSFSGSFQSLSDLLVKDGGSYIVRAGIASSVESAEALKKSVPTADFRGVNMSSWDYRDYFWSALGALEIPKQRAAILAEDETQFGEAVEAVENEKQDELGPVLTLKFPRDISQLRNAYRDNRSFAGEKRLPPEVEFSLKDGELGEDSIPSYSGVQGPLSQNARLERAVEIIRRDQILAVEIVATNVLDALFVARVLAQRSPDTRIILPFTSLLFAEAARTEGLRNVLALSSYPMFGGRKWWDQTLPLLTYQDNDSEGVYNAMALLLAKIEGFRGPSVAKVDDYWWDEQWHPPVWLLTLDRQGFLPIRAWTHDLKKEAAERWWQPVLYHGDREPQTRLPERCSPIWTFSAGLVGCAGLGAVIFSLALWKGNPRWDGRFLPCRINDKDCCRLLYLFNFFLALAAMEAVLCLPWWRLHKIAAADWGLAGSGFLALFALLIAVRWLYDELPNRKKIGYGIAVIISSLSAWGGALYFWWRASSTEQDSAGLFFCLRAVELRIGSSPALPILASFFALALYCYVHLHRIYLAACQEPTVVQGLTTALQSRLDEAQKSLSDHFGSPFGLVKWKEWACFGCGCIVVALLGFSFDPYSHIAGVDGAPFNLLLVPLQCLLVIAMLHSCIQISRMWFDLKSFLTCLGVLPLATSFIARDKVRSNRPIWVQNLNLQSLSTLVRGPLVLHDIALMDVDIRRMYESYADKVRNLIAGSAATRSELLTENKLAHDKNSEITTKLFHDIIRPRWLTSPLVGKLVTGNHNEDGYETEPVGRVGIPGDPDKISDLSQTFMALHFTPFLLYSVRQIQNLVWFLLLGFVALVLSMNADSPQSPQLISRFLLAFFAVIAVVLWRCLAGIERDPIISRIEGTQPGKLNGEFYLKLLGYGALPVLGLLASMFPSIANFLFSWVEPTFTAMQ
jgi:hypothetical protein